MKHVYSAWESITLFRLRLTLTKSATPGSVWFWSFVVDPFYALISECYKAEYTNCILLKYFMTMCQQTKYNITGERTWFIIPALVP